MGHVSGLKKYECVIWKVCMSLPSIDDGNLWWLWMKGVVGDLHLGIGLMYRLMRRIFVAKSCLGGERV